VDAVEERSHGPALSARDTLPPIRRPRRASITAAARKKWNQTPVLAGFFRESRRRNTRPRLCTCLFSIYRAKVEIVARVYRAIFDPFLRRRLTTRCIPPSPPPRRRRRGVVAASPSFPPPPPPCPRLVLSQQPAATLPSVTLHYLPLRNVEDASFHSGARKISSAVSSASRGSASVLMKFGDDPKLPRRIRVPSSALSMIRVAALWNHGYRGSIDAIRLASGTLRSVWCSTRENRLVDCYCCRTEACLFKNTLRVLYEYCIPVEIIRGKKYPWKRIAQDRLKLLSSLASPRCLPDSRSVPRVPSRIPRIFSRIKPV